MILSKPFRLQAYLSANFIYRPIVLLIPFIYKPILLLIAQPHPWGARARRLKAMHGNNSNGMVVQSFMFLLCVYRRVCIIVNDVRCRVNQDKIEQEAVLYQQVMENDIRSLKQKQPAYFDYERLYQTCRVSKELVLKKFTLQQQTNFSYFHVSNFLICIFPVYSRRIFCFQ